MHTATAVDLAPRFESDVSESGPPFRWPRTPFFSLPSRPSQSRETTCPGMRQSRLRPLRPLRDARRVTFPSLVSAWCSVRLTSSVSHANTLISHVVATGTRSALQRRSMVDRKISASGPRVEQGERGRELPSKKIVYRTFPVDEGAFVARPRVEGKFLHLGSEKFFVKGATYGAFPPNGEGHQFPEPATVARDFALMRYAGLNALLTYTVPPRWLLDLAQERGLRVIVTTPWMEYRCFLEQREFREQARREVREGVAACRSHPAVLMYCVGKEILDHGLAGAVIFGWTDPFFQDGCLIEEWGFGLVDAGRWPKLAYEAVRRRFLTGVPFPTERRLPRISVVVATYNAARTLDDCLRSLMKLDYPDYEVIVVNDGSTDGTSDIIRRYPFRSITTPNRGVSAARNEGLRAATGEIVAYIDSDARADSDWLSYFAATFLESDVVGVGGPNLVPPEDTWVAKGGYRGPGGPSRG